MAWTSTRSLAAVPTTGMSIASNNIGAPVLMATIARPPRIPGSTPRIRTGIDAPLLSSVVDPAAIPFGNLAFSVDNQQIDLTRTQLRQFTNTALEITDN